MINFINPLDLILAIIVLVIAIIGIYSGFIIECKKTVSLFIATLVSKLIIEYIPLLKNFLNPLLLYIITLILLIYLIRLFLNLIMHYIPSLEIDREVNGFMGGILGTLKGLILISVLLFIIELSPIQDSIKNKIFVKANQVSILFRTCDNIKSFISQ